ncbi:hypothetical protein QQG09_03130 [Melissococcus plutonius]|uniref:Uncharacterized protein n=1 Tax=Melissococcus plutonius TaxID=33970 RepID=A0A2Z5Y1L3_9ENTE|nr:hypothetical protein [Melissococcus plutonius]BAL61878.1 hypothetical protein MPD5_0612 [Melissococcus plutonius DAT561]AIM25861.1 hypothetical protein MEPL_c012900 [Melissococcus plutonius S1]KMT23817.1 hypothetical protein MEPL2_3c00120 [Melissococcus plutonius]KMT24340.1 hypothetical protein MEPL3_6c00120 [Melissococcus plutonius]KMT25913.1 hypothetical protein MEPL1_6c00120 [Melissococcus plutonius]
MNEQKKLRSSIDRVRKAPTEIFTLSQKKESGVYIYNHQGTISGVMLAVEQYENLLDREKQHTTEYGEYEQLEDLHNQICQIIQLGTIIPAKKLDDQLTTLGFLSKKSTESTYEYTPILNELNNKGKVIYQLKQKQKQHIICAEIIGKQSTHSTSADRLLVKKIHMKKIKEKNCLYT